MNCLDRYFYGVMVANHALDPFVNGGFTVVAKIPLWVFSSMCQWNSTKGVNSEYSVIPQI